MFSVEIRINGNLIGHVIGKNITLTGDDACIYEYEYYDAVDGRHVSGRVRHARSDKIRKLVGKIMRQADKKLE